ncbi:MAG TPA: molybdenum ABC transporter ATP-binding protein [Steroidobacteraceae bacterium]|nr:molybdenum ABC transporter ATP-binding protein [Steroidobacteraceae bacterium]
MIDFDARAALGSFHLDVTFRVPEAGTTVLFGPSGAGKTTVLALLAGAMKARSGRIEVGSSVFVDTARDHFVPLERRRLGWVFQDGRLFPHLTVAQNLTYGLKRRREEPIRVDEGRVLEVLGIGGLLDRWPRDLSGGERQRIAIGRALLAQPRLLLMDEPLASLDVPRKREILELLASIGIEFAIPIVYVTHSLAELVRLADHVVLLDRGRVLAHGPANDLLGRSDTPLLAARGDAGAIIEAPIAAQRPERGTTVLTLGAQQLQIPYLGGGVGHRVRVHIIANDVIVATERPRAISVRNVLSASVSRLSAREDGAVNVELALSDEHRLLATVTQEAVRELKLAPGLPVFALLKSVAIDAPAGSRLLEIS